MAHCFWSIFWGKSTSVGSSCPFVSNCRNLSKHISQVDYQVWSAMSARTSCVIQKSSYKNHPCATSPCLSKQNWNRLSGLRKCDWSCDSRQGVADCSTRPSKCTAAMQRLIIRSLSASSVNNELMLKCRAAKWWTKWEWLSISHNCLQHLVKKTKQKTFNSPLRIRPFNGPKCS